MRILSALVLLVNVYFTIEADCPQPELLYPCTCEGNSITCSTNLGQPENYSIKTKFEAVSKSITSESNKHFDTLGLYGLTHIKVFEDNVFGNITFKHIMLNNIYNLERISAHAFDASVDTLESFTLGHNTMLGKDEDGLFKAFSSLNNLKKLDLWQSRISVIPSYAFSNSKQTKLESIYLNSGGALSGFIKSIGNYAFSALTNLRYLSLSSQAIEHIANNAFDFNTPSNQTLEVDLSRCLLNGSRFESGVFLNSKRPLNLTLSGSGMDFLDEKIFAPFLRLDRKNFITFSASHSENNCDCRSYWLIRDRAQFKDQLNLDIRCANHKDTNIWEVEESLFAHCK